jgi:RHS repeat-associated protein
LNDRYYFKWSYSYDTTGNLVTQKDPMDATTTYTYSGNDLIKATDPKGNILQYVYSTDGKRLLISSKDAQGNFTSYAYDSLGRVMSVTDSKGAVTKYTYNSYGDIATVISPKNEVTRYGYDVLGRKTAEVTALGFATKYNYDKLSQVTSIVNPAGLTISYSYDANGNATQIANPNATKKRYVYDKLNRLSSVIDEIGASISCGYDVAGNKTSYTDANGKTTKYVYDELNQLMQQIDPTGKVVTVNHDQNGNVSSTVDQKGNTTTNTYDKSGDLISTNNGSVKSDLILDANSNVAKIVTSDKQSTSVYYDANSNPTKVSSSVLGDESATYDKLGQVASHAVTTEIINLVRDANGAVISVANKLLKTSTDLGTTSYSNDPDGKLRVITKPNADTSTFSYDSSGRVSAISNVNKLGAIQKNYSYTYDLASNQTAIKDNTGVIKNYAYDARNELVTDGTKKYTYDPMGNRKTVTDGTTVTNYVYDTAGDANRLLKVTYSDGRIVTYEYDGNGNIIKETDSKNGITAYVYDSDNYFTKATLPDKTTVQYTYDQISKLRAQRVLTTPTGTKTTTKFVYSGDRLVSETDTAGNVLKNYTWDEQENLISFTIPVSGVMTTYYYVKNAKGDVVGLSNKDGKMVVAYDYDAWGNLTVAKNLVTTGIPANLYMQNPRLYGSYWYDSTLGLYFMKTRMYDPEFGRFMSKDQVSGGGGSALDFNPYLYCNNNPISRIDSDGKAWYNTAWNWVKKTATTVWNAAVSVVKAVVNFVEQHVVQPLVNTYHKASTWVAKNSTKAYATTLVALQSAAKASSDAVNSSGKSIGDLLNWGAGGVYESEGERFAVKFSEHGMNMSEEAYDANARAVVQYAEKSGKQLNGNMIYVRNGWITITKGKDIITSFKFDKDFGNNAEEKITTAAEYFASRVPYIFMEMPVIFIVPMDIYSTPKVKL